MDKNWRIAAFGGGTGLAALLSGLKTFTRLLTGVVTVTDDGGSSGDLRRQLGVLPPGDIRNCLVALADEGKLLAKLFQYRFGGKKGLAGHSFGNLFLTALTDICGGFDEAVLESSKVLAIRGRVLPVTLENITLAAKLSDGKIVYGETKITKSPKKIEKLFLRPVEHPRALPAVLKAIEEAEAIVFGPGSLYTSVLPHLLVEGIIEKIENSAALKIYVCNLMTQKAETSNFKASDHLKIIFQHCGKKIFDYVIVNEGRFSGELLQHYAEADSQPVVVDKEMVGNLGVKIMAANLIDNNEFGNTSQGKYARHDSLKLAQTVINLLSEKKKSRPLEMTLR
ncbi:MAG: gluconeogenesis factor YvcK family protein [Elusimicrobiota bacterium]